VNPIAVKCISYFIYLFGKSVNTQIHGQVAISQKTWIFCFNLELVELLDEM
jgi:hypothetical protein